MEAPLILNENSHIFQRISDFNFDANVLLILTL